MLWKFLNELQYWRPAYLFPIEMTTPIYLKCLLCLVKNLNLLRDISFRTLSQYLPNVKGKVEKFLQALDSMENN